MAGEHGAEPSHHSFCSSHPDDWTTIVCSVALHRLPATVSLDSLLSQ